MRSQAKPRTWIQKAAQAKTTDLRGQSSSGLGAGAARAPPMQLAPTRTLEKHDEQEILDLLPAVGETNPKDAQASIQVYIRGENWRKLLERLEWSPLAIASGKTPEQIDRLRGGAVLELIVRGVLVVKDSTVRTPSAAAAERNRFRATPVTLNHLLSGLVPNSTGPLTTGIFEKMDQNSKLKVFCRGLCSYVSPLMAVLEPASLSPPSKKKRQTTLRKRSRVVTEELDEGASFLLSLGSKDDEDQTKNSHPPPQPLLTQLSGPL